MDDIREVVFSKRPKLKELYEREKETRLVSYLSSVSIDARKVSDIFLNIFKDEVQKIFGDIGLNEKIDEYFKKTNYVSTVDHHGILSHSSFIQAHLAQSLVAKNNNLKIIPVLSSGSVSLDNHTFPRGLIFYGKNGEVRIPIITSRHRQESSLGAPPPVKEQILHALSRIKKELPLPLYEILERVLQTGLDKKNFSEYASMVNRGLFSNIPKFGSADLIMIPHERISARMIIESADIQNIFFANEFIPTYEREYKNIIGAHTDDGIHGTFLFWRIISGKREKLRFVENNIQNGDGSFSVAYSKDNIIQLLKSGELIPCMALSYTILGSTGLTLGGGFNQVDYLEKIYGASKKFFPNFSFTNAGVMVGDFVFAGVRSGEKVFGANYIDILKHLALSGGDEFMESIQNVTLEQAISGVLPDAYFTDTKKLPKISYEPKIIF